MTVLVTGASGFIGSHLIAHRTQQGHHTHIASRAPQGTQELVTTHSGDLLDQDYRQRLIDEVQPKTIIHLAWEVTPGTYLHDRSNLEWSKATQDLFRVFADAGGKRFVGAGTCFELAPQDRPLAEGDPTASEHLYGQAKDACRRALATAGESAGLATSWARIFFVYGPRESTQRFVPATLARLQAGQPMECDPPDTVRDFVFVADVAEALQRLLATTHHGTIHLGSGRPTTIGDMVAAMERATGIDGLVTFHEPASSSPARIQSDPKHMEATLGWRPGTSLDQGMAQTLATLGSGHRQPET